MDYDYEMLSPDSSLYTEAPAEGLYTEGLFLEGCAWDSNSGQLCESEAKVGAVHMQQGGRGECLSSREEGESV